MDISRCIKFLEQKNLILVCPDREKRIAVTALLVKYLKEKRYQTFQLPENIKSYEKYLHQAMKHFPMRSPLKIHKEEMGYNQINDVQLDWLVPGTKTAIVIPEIQKLKENDSDEFMTLLSRYFTASFAMWDSGHKSSFRFMLTLNELSERDLDGLELYLGRKASDNRPVREVARDHLQIYQYPV